MIGTCWCTWKRKKKKIVEKCLLRPRSKNLLLHFFANFIERKIHRNVKKKNLTPKKRKKSLHTKIQKKSDLRKLRCFYAFRKLAHSLREARLKPHFQNDSVLWVDFFRLTLNEERCWCYCLSKIVHCTASISTWVFRINVLHVQSDVSEIVHRCYTISC